MKKVIVVGAGIVGICCAISLRKKGFHVTLIDRQQPGRGASFGNAGVFNNSAIAPYQRPEILRLLPRLLAGRDPRFRLHWPHLFLLIPCLIRFLSNCNNRSFEAGMAGLSYLLKDAVELHLELLKQSGGENYFRDTGWLRLIATREDFMQTKSERGYFDRYGVAYEILDTGEIKELEPDISRHYHKGIWLTNTPSITSPEKVCLAYADYFQSLGGNFQVSSAQKLGKLETGWKLSCDNGEMEADSIVVAMGAQSTRLLSTTGVTVPMVIERGYHLVYQPEPGKSLGRSIIDTQYGLVMTPMETGIRVTSAVNLVAREIPPTFRQILDLAPQIESIFPFQKHNNDEPWMGNRPSTPDSLPIIGPAPGHDGLWLAFGHGHLGLTLGPKTGILIADAMAGKTTDSEANAFLPSRF
jgi:D-amino-acid dehydrogenase